MLRIRSDVRIRELGPEDAERIYRWLCDPVIAKGLGLRRDPTPEYTLNWIQRSLEDPLTSAYALLLNGSHVGNAVLDKTDSYLRTSRLSIYLGNPDVRGMGVGLTGIYYALLDGFKKYNLHKVWLTVDVSNRAALNTYKTLNFRVEGVLRGEFLRSGERRDAYYMGLLHSEFEQLHPMIG